MPPNLRITRITTSPANILPPSILVRAQVVNATTGVPAEVVAFVPVDDIDDENSIKDALEAAEPDIDFSL